MLNTLPRNSLESTLNHWVNWNRYCRHLWLGWWRGKNRGYLRMRMGCCIRWGCWDVYGRFAPG